MSILSDLAHIAADTLPVWRDSAVALLAGVVIASLWFYASATE